jgi:regulatory protein
METMSTKEFEKVKDRALRLLARRDHSSLELKNKLKQKLKIENSVFDELLTHLKSLGLMADEEDLSQRWIVEWRAAGRGRHWISGKLRSKGLPKVDLHDDEEERDAAVFFLEKRLRGKSIKDLRYEERAKLGRTLVSRGFSMSLVAEIIK